MNDTKILGQYSWIEDYSPDNKVVPYSLYDIGAEYNKQKRDIHRGILVVKVPSVNINPRVQTTAKRVSLIARDLIGILAWTDNADMSPSLRTWRELSIESVRVGCNIFLQESLTDGEMGLEKDQMKLISGMAKQTARCFNEYYKSPEIFAKRKPEDVHKTLRILIERLLKKKFPQENELLLQYDALSQVFLDGCIADFITPPLITKILLNLEFPYGAAADEDEGKNELFKLCEEHAEECNELGDAIIDCVDIMLNTAKNRLIDQAAGIFKLKHAITKVGVNIGTGFLRKFKKYIGGYIFATVNAALRSEGSKVLQIVEMWIQRAGKPKEEIDETALRAELDASIRKDMSRLVKYVINEKKGESEGLKDQAGKIIEEIAPLLVELVWDTQSRPVANLLFNYLPEAPLQQFFSEVANDSMQILPHPARYQRLENLIILFVQDYLLPENTDLPLNKNQENWKAIFMCSIKIGVRRVFAASEEVQANGTTHENILRLGFVFAAINSFLCESIAKKHTFDMTSEEIDRPLVNLLQFLVKEKYPGKAEVQKEVVTVSRGLVNKAIETIFDPFFISNLILKIKLDKSLIQASDMQGKDLLGYDAVGLEAVRLLRTVLSLGNKDDSLGWIDAIVASIARKHKEMIGSKIAQAIHAAAQSNDPVIMDLLEKVLWRVKEDNSSQPIFFDGWIEDRVKLQEALMKWLENELLPFVSEAISSQGFWGTGMIESKLRSIVKTVAEKFFHLLWHDDNKAIKVLILRHLLPIMKNYFR